MKILPFKKSSPGSIGIELELQLIDPVTYDLVAHAKDLIRNIQDSKYSELIKPEITQSMIELNSSIHQSPDTLYVELKKIRDFLLQQANNIGIKISGGGTHPFQKWALRKIFPTIRFKHLSWRFKYLSKQATVFGQHIHIGCKNAEDALYLTHVLARYVPHLIALSASSPFYQGIDTGHQTCRINIFNGLPMSGVIPFLTTWKEFSGYFYKMKKLGIISSMKDCYWDVRPKPEFGTVEVRVCDTPLTIEKSVLLAAYLQTLSHFILSNKKFKLSEDLYYLYLYNRFQASRFGFEGDIIDYETFKHDTISDDILNTLKLIQKDAKILHNESYLKKIYQIVINNKNDADNLRALYKKTKSLKKVVGMQCDAWAKKIKSRNRYE